MTKTPESNPEAAIRPFGVEGLHDLLDVARRELARRNPDLVRGYHLFENNSFRRFAARRNLSRRIEEIARFSAEAGRPLLLLQETDGGGQSQANNMLRIRSNLMQLSKEIQEKIDTEIITRSEMTAQLKRGYLARAVECLWDLFAERFSAVFNVSTADIEQGVPWRCETSFWYSGSSNCLLPLKHRGVIVEEAMHGIVWTRRLPKCASDEHAGETLGAKYPVGIMFARVVGDDADARSSFVVRERVQGPVFRIVLSVRSMRVVSFFSVRRSVQSSEVTGEANKGVSFDKFLSEFESACAYLVTWIHNEQLDFLDDGAERWNFETSAYSSLLKAANVLDPKVRHLGGLTSDSELTVEQNSAIEIIQAAISSAIDVKPSPACYVYLAKKKEDRYFLVFPTANDESVSYAIGENNNEVHKGLEVEIKNGDWCDYSVCAQALAWKVPLLISDTLAPASEGSASFRLRKMHVRRVSDKGHGGYRSLVAVPVYDKNGTPLAVICIEHRYQGKLDGRHVRRVGILANIVSKMILSHSEASSTSVGVDTEPNALQSRVSDAGRSAKSGWKWIEATCARGQEPATPKELLKRFLVWTREELDASLTYLIGWDRSLRTMMPIAVSASDKFINDYVTRVFVKENTHRSYDGVNLPIESIFESPLFRDMFEEYLVPKLMPRPFGRSWRIIEGRETLGLFDTAEMIEKSESRSLAREMCQRRIAIPFVSDVSAQPDGALWVWWHSGFSRHETGDIRKIVQDYKNRIDNVSQVVAGMLAISRRGKDAIWEESQRS